jgi:excisionase family DNA binding protein
MTQALLSVEQAAQRLGGVSRWSIYAWLSQGRIRKTKVGSRVMIGESDSTSIRCRVQPRAACTAQSGILEGVMSRAAARRSKPQATERPALHLVPDNEPAVKWAEYPRIEPGDYPAYCKRANVVLGPRLQTVDLHPSLRRFERGPKWFAWNHSQCGSTAVPGKGPKLAGAHSTFPLG